MICFLRTRLTWKSRSLFAVGLNILLDHRRDPLREKERDNGAIEALKQVRNLYGRQIRVSHDYKLCLNFVFLF